MALAAATPSRLLGSYQLIVELGKSHLGALWAARGPGEALFNLRRLPTAGLEPAVLKRVLEAARRGSQFTHPNVAKVHEALEVGAELLVSTQLAHGELLRSMLRLSNFLRKPFPEAVALSIAQDLLSALAYGEAHGMRAPFGLNPDTVMVEQSGLTLFLDPCLAGQLQLEGIGSDSADAAAYQSVESARGQLGPAGDVFSVGVLLWEMLMGGRRLFAGANRQAVVARMESLDIAELSGFKLPGGKQVSAQVSALVLRALSRDAEKRFPSYQEMSAAIAATQIPQGPADVRDFLKELAGTALAAREKLIGRGGVDGKSHSPAPPSVLPQVVTQPKVALLSTAPATPPPGPASPAVSASAPISRAPGLGPPPINAAKRRTILGMAPPKPADVLRASQMVSHAEIEAVEPSIAAGPPVAVEPTPASEGEIASELLDALAREPSSSVASSEPFATPPLADLPHRREEEITKTTPLSPERLAELVSAVTLQAGVDARENEITLPGPLPGPLPSEHEMLGSLVREVLNTAPNEEGHTEQTKLSVGVVPASHGGVARKSRLWHALAAVLACLLLFLGWRWVAGAKPPEPPQEPVVQAAPVEPKAIEPKAIEPKAIEPKTQPQVSNVPAEVPPAPVAKEPELPPEPAPPLAKPVAAHPESPSAKARTAQPPPVPKPRAVAPAPPPRAAKAPPPVRRPPAPAAKPAKKTGFTPTDI
ncbi:MAG: protein kinase [Polyangiaceae bacterium]|nr:protein kinase [Polyangiaceae bacterium]